MFPLRVGPGIDSNCLQWWVDVVFGCFGVLGVAMVECWEWRSRDGGVVGGGWEVECCWVASCGVWPP